MPLGEHQRLDRRERRKRVFRDRPFHRLDVQLERQQDLPKSRQLSDYFYTAAMRLETMHGDAPVRARLAQFPDMTFVHAILPRMSVTWQRDHLSLDRILVIIVRKGNIEVNPTTHVIRKHQAYLFLQHEVPVRISVVEPETELIYMSLPARLGNETVPARARGGAAELPFELLAPVYAFVASLCALSFADVHDFDPIASSAEEIARSTIRFIAGSSADRQPTLFHRAMESILDHYVDSRFGIKDLAQALGVSVRTLQLAFKEEQTTVSSTLRRVRVAAAQRIMEEHPKMLREQVAQLAGFGSKDSLWRALRSLEAVAHE